MDQILALAPSISRPMLPVVSRQNTTSTRSLSAGRPGPAAGAGKVHRPRARAPRESTRSMVRPPWRVIVQTLEEGAGGDDCHASVTKGGETKAEERETRRGGEGGRREKFPSPCRM